MIIMITMINISMLIWRSNNSINRSVGSASEPAPRRRSSPCTRCPGLTSAPAADGFPSGIVRWNWNDTEKISTAPAQGWHAQIGKCKRFYQHPRPTLWMRSVCIGVANNNIIKLNRIRNLNKSSNLQVLLLLLLLLLIIIIIMIIVMIMITIMVIIHTYNGNRKSASAWCPVVAKREAGRNHGSREPTQLTRTKEVLNTHHQCSQL